MASHAAPDVRRSQILDAALRCFGRKGLHVATIDDIARAAGLSKGAIYWHFESKDEIFLALFDAFQEAVFAEWERAEQPSALETLRRDGEIVIGRLLETRVFLDAWAEFLRHPTARRRLARLYRRSRARLAATLRRGLARGELRRCDPERTAAALMALVEGLLLQAFADPDYDVAAAWPAAWDLVASGLAPAPAARAKRPEGRRRRRSASRAVG